MFTLLKLLSYVYVNLVVWFNEVFVIQENISQCCRVNSKDQMHDLDDIMKVPVISFVI